jgi:glutamate-1-semialdehyde 2,1-aminomutase
MNKDNSKKLFEEAKKYIVGGVNSPVRAFSSVGGEPIFIKKGEGACIIDEDDNRYVDYVQSWGPLIFGHCDEKIEKATIDAIKNGLSFGAPTKVETELAKEVLELFPNLEKIRFVSSGTEATMSAIRLARGVTKKDDIIKFEGCYHGHSDSLLVSAGSGAATFGTPSSPGVIEDLSKHTLLAKYNNIQSVKKCFEDGNVGCVIIEPIAGNMNLIPADKEFLITLQALCKKHGALLIFDEVMSGFRASCRGSNRFYDIEADIVTFGKVIGGGMPVGAFASSKEIMSYLSPEGAIYQAGTLSGNPVAMSAGLASIKKLKSNIDVFQELEEKAKKMMDGFAKISEENGINIQTNVRGSMFGFCFLDFEPKNFDDILKADTALYAKFHGFMLEKGFYFAPSAFETGFISTKITDEMVEETIKAYEEFIKGIK